MKKSKQGNKIIVFTCNWHAYSSLERVGIEGLSLLSVVYPIRLACLGRITPGIILKAFEQGVGGILLLGCPEGECRHNAGNQAAREIFHEARSLLRLLGYNENKLRYALLQAENGKEFVKELDSLLSEGKKIKG